VHRLARRVSSDGPPPLLLPLLRRMAQSSSQAAASGPGCCCPTWTRLARRRCSSRRCKLQATGLRSRTHSQSAEPVGRRLAGTLEEQGGAWVDGTMCPSWLSWPGLRLVPAAIEQNQFSPEPRRLAKNNSIHSTVFCRTPSPFVVSQLRCRPVSLVLFKFRVILTFLYCSSNPLVP